MTDSDLARIELELGISLPLAYKTAVSPYPIPALSGNSESEFWDSASELIELNKTVRAGLHGLKPWPTWLFAVGELDGESFVAIDLRDPEAPTWWIDHGGIDNKGSGQTHSRFNDWVTTYVNELRMDLQGEGFDPNDTPEVYNRRLAERSSRNSVGCLTARRIRGSRSVDCVVQEVSVII